MIAEKQTVSVQEIQDLQQQILEAERNLARLAAKLEEIKSAAAALAPSGVEADTTRKARIAQAKQEIFTEYESLLSELAK